MGPGILYAVLAIGTMLSTVGYIGLAAYYLSH